MSGGEALIRAFGDLSEGSGGVTWNLGGNPGGLVIRDGEVTSGQEEADGSGWSFEDRLDPDPTAGAGLVRYLAIEVPGRGTLVCSSRGEPGIQGHDAEEATGRLEGETGPMSYGETLISTQYDGEGKPSRFGLELWTDEADPTNRAGATRTSGTLLGAGSIDAVWVGFFRCHTDGAEGLGTYLLWRA